MDIHNAEFYPVTFDELGGWLKYQGFREVNLTYRRRPIKEYVFERKYAPYHYIRVYTGINRFGWKKNTSRKVGTDAIRVQAVYKDGRYDTLVENQKRVHRVRGWKENLKSRIIDILKRKPLVVTDSRGVPMVLRTNKRDGSKFWGSRDYPRHKETKPFIKKAEFYMDLEDPNRGYWDEDTNKVFINLANPRLDIKDIPSIITHEYGHKVAGQGLVPEEQRYEEDYQNWLQLEMAAFLVQEEGDWDRARIRASFHPNCSFFIEDIGLEKWLNSINFDGNEDLLEDGRKMLEWMNHQEAVENGPLNISVFGKEGYYLFKDTVEATLSHGVNETFNEAYESEDHPQVALPDSPFFVDKEILPLITYFHNAGINTLWSCQGDPNDSLSGYIMFETDDDQKIIIELLNNLIGDFPIIPVTYVEFLSEKGLDISKLENTDVEIYLQVKPTETFPKFTLDEWNELWWDANGPKYRDFIPYPSKNELNYIRNNATKPILYFNYELLKSMVSNSYSAEEQHRYTGKTSFNHPITGKKWRLLTAKWDKDGKLVAKFTDYAGNTWIVEWLFDVSNIVDKLFGHHEGWYSKPRYDEFNFNPFNPEGEIIWLSSKGHLIANAPYISKNHYSTSSLTPFKNRFRREEGSDFHSNIINYLFPTATLKKLDNTIGEG